MWLMGFCLWVCEFDWRVLVWLRFGICGLQGLGFGGIDCGGIDCGCDLGFW